MNVHNSVLRILKYNNNLKKKIIFDRSDLTFYENFVTLRLLRR